ncbi:adenylate kinase family enzyme [Bradyrhizobium sp. LM2.7]
MSRVAAKCHQGAQDRRAASIDRILGRALPARESGEAVRPDDNHEALSVRLTSYAIQTTRLIDYYAAKGLLQRSMPHCL